MGTLTFVRGAIYEIAIDDVVRCRVWREADVDAETGARCAEEIAEHVRAHVLVSRKRTSGFVFDVRDAPAAFGPRTQVALTALFGELAARGVRIAVLTADNAIQRMQFGRLCADISLHAVVVADEAAALAFVQRRP